MNLGNRYFNLIAIMVVKVPGILYSFETARAVMDEVVSI